MEIVVVFADYHCSRRKSIPLYVTRVAAITANDSTSQREEKAREKGEVGLDYFYLRTLRDKLLRRGATRRSELQFHKFEWRLPLPVMRSYCIISQSSYDIPSTIHHFHPIFSSLIFLSFPLLFLSLSLFYFISFPHVLLLTFSSFLCISVPFE